jgi:formylmethanofuran dehydrogenase subunit C
MLQLTLTLNSLIPLEAETIVPNCLVNLSNDAIATLPVQHGNRTLALRDAFDISGDARDGHIEISGDCARVKWLGRGMASGKLAIRGSAGLHTGAEMRGGEIEVFQDASDWLGAEMRGGSIHVRGNAGNNVGSTYRGGEKGMRGGSIFIDGNAGHEVGALMRRGLIAVGGACGDFAGISMIAGTIIAQSFGTRTGAGMKRGTIVVLSKRIEMPQTFRYDCEYEPVFLTMYFTYLRQKGFAYPALLEQRRYRRYSGDMLALGKGEVLIPI